MPNLPGNIMYTCKGDLPGQGGHCLARSELASISKDIGMVEKNREGLIALEANLESLYKNFAANYRDGQFLVNLDRSLREAGVRLIGLRTIGITQEEGCFALSLEIELSGDYNRLCGIVGYLENQSNLTEIRELLITKALTESKEEDLTGADPLPGEVPGYLPPDQVVAKFTMLIFFLEPGDVGLLQEEVKNWSFGRQNPFLTPSR
ncbi:hypothetical protein N752_13260 [Desulforamulus aquiferis]|nr:hypothetical protein [Desulforamulus aquiferis]RYD04336.1 hypothetical protein N752_13260 [Desulforamulus aquiferis]